MVRAAILGLGRWGRSLVVSVQGKSDAIRFVSGATRTRETADGFCREHGIALADNYEQILSDPAIDAVVLATPHSQHEEQIKLAAAAGKHVFVEKPIALDHAGARAAADAIAKAGLVLAVGFNRRFHPSITEIRARLDDGRLGRLVAMTGQHTTSTGAFIAHDNWRADPAEAPAGAMTAVGVHLLDTMIGFAGRVRHVHCVTGAFGKGPADDTTTVMLTFENGTVGTIFCSVATATNFNLAVYGTKGLVDISGSTLQRFKFVPGATQPTAGQVAEPVPEERDHSGFDSLKAEMTAFARAVTREAQFPVPLDDVLHGMAVFDAVVASSKSGGVVAVAG